MCKSAALHKLGAIKQSVGIYGVWRWNDLRPSVTSMWIDGDLLLGVCFDGVRRAHGGLFTLTHKHGAVFPSWGQLGCGCEPISVSSHLHNRMDPRLWACAPAWQTHAAFQAAQMIYTLRFFLSFLAKESLMTAWAATKGQNETCFPGGHTFRTCQLSRRDVYSSVCTFRGLMLD